MPFCGNVKPTGVSKGSEGEYETSMIGYLSGWDFSRVRISCSEAPRAVDELSAMCTFAAGEELLCLLKKPKPLPG